MIDLSAGGARTTRYRWFVFALAAFYFVDRARTTTYGLDDFGWQFRYLTIWALTLSLIAAALMLARRFGAPDGRGAVYVSVTAVINMIVVVSYWRLYFRDPTLVNGDNPVAAYREYYLHLVGPLLQWIDVLCLKRGFRRPGAAALWLGVLVLAYLGWAELVVAPLNDVPVGRVTSGLPYPFLNDMSLGARLVFYAATWASGLIFIALLRALQWGVDRWWPADRARG